MREGMSILDSKTPYRPLTIDLIEECRDEFCKRFNVGIKEIRAGKQAVYELINDLKKGTIWEIGPLGVPSSRSQPFFVHGIEIIPDPDLDGWRIEAEKRLVFDNEPIIEDSRDLKYVNLSYLG